MCVALFTLKHGVISSPQNASEKENKKPKKLEAPRSADFQSHLRGEILRFCATNDIDRKTQLWLVQRKKNSSDLPGYCFLFVVNAWRTCTGHRTQMKQAIVLMLNWLPSNLKYSCHIISDSLSQEPVGGVGGWGVGGGCCQSTLPFFGVRFQRWRACSFLNEMTLVGGGRACRAYASVLWIELQLGALYSTGQKGCCFAVSLIYYNARPFLDSCHPNEWNHVSAFPIRQWTPISALTFDRLMSAVVNI